MDGQEHIEYFWNSRIVIGILPTLGIHSFSHTRIENHCKLINISVHYLHEYIDGETSSMHFREIVFIYFYPCSDHLMTDCCNLYLTSIQQENAVILLI